MKRRFMKRRAIWLPPSPPWRKRSEPGRLLFARMRHFLYHSLVLLLFSAGVLAADDTVLRDFDISMSQPQCKRIAANKAV